MSTWAYDTVIDADPETVLTVLTDPSAACRWSPVEFDLDGPRGSLTQGSRVSLSGRLAGVRVTFEVVVRRADATSLELTATGPVLMDVVYRLAPLARGSELRARVSVHGAGGLMGAMLAKAADAVLAAGALQAAVARIAREVEAL